MSYVYKYKDNMVGRSDGSLFFKKSRCVYVDFFTKLSSCMLKQCRFPTITCDKCFYCV